MVGLFASASELLRADPVGKMEFVLLYLAKAGTWVVRQMIAVLFEGGSSERAHFLVGCICLTGAAVFAGEHAIAPFLRHRPLPLIVGAVTASPVEWRHSELVGAGAGARAVLESVLGTIIVRLKLRRPAHDQASRRPDSWPKLSERGIVSRMGSPAARYATVGMRLLLSIVEDADWSGPMVVVARGPFGKAV
jgi:hypothetical protein